MFTEKRLGQAQINNVSPTTLYTVPSNTKGIVRDFVITNTTGTATTISIWMVGSGDSSAILKSFTVPASDLVHFSMWQVLEATETITAQAGTASSITITVSGAEI